MKIGFFTDSYRPYVSGVVRSIDTFARELMRLGHEVYIFAPRYPQDGGKEVNIYRFPSFHTPFYPEFYISLPIPWPAKRYAEEWELDIIHAHSPFILGYLGASFAKKLNIPLVFTYHTLYDQYTHYIPLVSGLVQKGVITVARDFCNRCDLVITPTGIIKKLLLGYGISSPIIPIPTGIQPEKFRSGDDTYLNRKFGIPEMGKVLLFVGRLGKEKNLEYLLRVFALVRKDKSDVYLVLVGSGPEAENLKKLAQEAGVVDRVVFTGLLPPEVIADVYRSADCFVFPSVTETQGLVLAEAMAAGLPVVAQAAFGSMAMVEDGITGYLCHDGEQEFARHIISILDDRDLRTRMSKAALMRAWQLSAERMARRLERAYTALIAKEREEIERLAAEEI